MTVTIDNYYNNAYSNYRPSPTAPLRENCPTADAILVDLTNDKTQAQSYPIATSNSSNYASAQVVGMTYSEQVSPSNPALATVTTTETAATALDPWSSVPTTVESNTVTQSPQRTTVSIFEPSSVAAPAMLFLEDPFRKKIRRRHRRRVRMATSGIAGFFAGVVIFGPIGAAVGVPVGAGVARVASKIGERRKDRRVQRQIDTLAG